MPAPLHPPKEWFSKPDQIPTDKRITIEESGRVYGYIALWDTCHAGMPNCVKPPRTGDYSSAHAGETVTEDGTIVATANIGGGAGHAPANHPAPAKFYDNTSTQLMRVTYGEDDNGIWFSGALWPDVSDLDVAHIRASAISGDWRHYASFRKSNTGEYTFVGSCLVNMPGYPMDKVASGHPEFITASAAIINIVEEEPTMSCQCKQEQEPKCPCGEKPAAECQCKNEDIKAAAVDESALADLAARVEALEQAEMRREADALAAEVEASFSN